MKVIKYGANWCGPCRVTSSNLKELGVEFEDIDVDENPEISEEKNLRSIPVIEFYDNDELVYTHIGLLTKEKIKEIMKI